MSPLSSSWFFVVVLRGILGTLQSVRRHLSQTWAVRARIKRLRRGRSVGVSPRYNSPVTSLARGGGGQGCRIYRDRSAVEQDFLPFLAR